MIVKLVISHYEHLTEGRFVTIIAVGVIIWTSLSYASQLLSTGHTCSAERFDNKAGPFVGSIKKTILCMQW